MKKVFVVGLLMFICFFIVTGCALIANEEVKEEEEIVKEANVEAEVEEEVVEEIEEPVVEFSKEDAVEAESTIKSPAVVGQWVKAFKYSPVDAGYHEVLFRIVGFYDPTEDIKAINESESLLSFDEVPDNRLEYRGMNYEVYFPEDFPTQEWGISTPTMFFSFTSVTGGDLSVDSKTKGVAGFSWDISDVDNITVNPGDTFEGKTVVILFKDESQFMVRYDYNTSMNSNVKNAFIRVE